MGKFSDKLLGTFRFDDDDDYDEYEDEDYATDDYDDDDYEEESKPLFGKKKSSQRTYEEEPARESSNRFSFSKSQPKPAAKSGGNEVCIIKPSSIEDSREITETLLNGKAVVINFEGLHVEISQRIIDFISGSCYALDGNLQKISNYIFIATPNSVDISGDFQDIFGGAEDNAFDIAGFKSPLL